MDKIEWHFFPSGDLVDPVGLAYGQAGQLFHGQPDRSWIAGYARKLVDTASFGLTSTG